MKKSLLTILSFMLTVVAIAQFPRVTIRQIQEVSQQRLNNCDDVSDFDGDTVTIVAYAVHDGGLSEVASGSVAGGNRPFVFFNDTTNGGAIDEWSGIEVMGVVSDANGSLIPVTNFTALLAGDIVEMTGVVAQFEGSSQFTPLDDNSFSIIGSLPASSIQAKTINMGDLNDANRVNQISTGEKWENVFVEFTDVTVVSVNFFSSGSRISFDVADQQGNVLNVSDRFLAQRLPAHQVVNPNSPNATSQGGPGTGTFVAPTVGTFYSSLKGLVRQSANGCTGANGRGYELNPFDDSHYTPGAPRPTFSNLNFTPIVPTSSQAVDVSIDIEDLDGTISRAVIYYSTNANASVPQYDSIVMTQVGSTKQFTAQIPAQANGSDVFFFFRATDNANQTSINPFIPITSYNDPTTFFYSVNDKGTQIVNIQRVLDPAGSGNSPLLGRTVTVSGVVTASEATTNLGYVYIQQRDAQKWSGINVYGSSALGALSVGDSVTVTGDVIENFSFTRLNASAVTNHGAVAPIEPVYLDPSAANLQMEEYEGVLVAYISPSDKVWIVNADAGFAEYTVGSVQNAGATQRVMAGRRNSSSFSSLNTSLVTSTEWATTAGNMNVPVVLTNTSINMDTLVGPVYFSFGTYKVTPRNNDDLKGLNVPIEPHQITAPTTTPATAVTDSSFVANWEAGDVEVEYLLTVSENSDLSNPLTNYDGVTVANIASEIAGLKDDFEYYYGVVGVSPLPGILGNSVLSNITSVTTLEKTDVGVSELQNRFNRLFVYPNPAADQVFVVNDLGAENVMVTLTDATGKVVLNSALNGDQLVDLSQIPSGFYQISLTVDGELSGVSKLIIR